MTKHKRPKVRRSRGSGSIVERKAERVNKRGQRVTVTEVFARIRFLDDDGKRKERRRLAKNRTHAVELIDEMKRELKDYGETALDHRHMTFADLADHYNKHYLKEAEYVDGRKVDGLRSVRSQKLFLKALRKRFDRKRLDKITKGDCRTFRGDRLKTPTSADLARYTQEMKQYKAAIRDLPKREQKKHVPPQLRCTRSIASVNRELALLRRMFNVAQEEGWLKKNPMSKSGLISVADERKRERIITLAEEARLLAACDDDKRRHLRPIVIAALETGMRKGELLKLKWSDVDLVNRLINVQAFNTKTMTSRQAPISTQLLTELEQLQQAAPAHSTDALVFGIYDTAKGSFKSVDDVKRSFNSARRAAGLPDVRFHDLRHTAATRLVSALPLPEVGRILGHTKPETTYRYTNANSDTMQRGAKALDGWREAATRESSEVQPAEGMIN